MVALSHHYRAGRGTNECLSEQEALLYVIFRSTWAIDVLGAAEASTADTAVFLVGGSVVLINTTTGMTFTMASITNLINIEATNWFTQTTKSKILGHFGFSKKNLTKIFRRSTHYRLQKLQLSDRHNETALDCHWKVRVYALLFSILYPYIFLLY